MSKILVAQEVIQQHIFLIRGEKVMLSSHLAQLYRVEVKVLIQAVKRNKERFPADFMFQLNKKEFKNLKSQIVTSSWGGARRARPYAFTEQGVAMLSSVLNSKHAIRVNIAIMRIFVKLRKMLLTHRALANKLAQLEIRISRNEVEIASIFEAIHQLMEPPLVKEKRIIGFHP